jgi:hypothetical protein
MDLEKALAIINDFIQAGWHIDYEIIDQVENGYGTIVNGKFVPRIFDIPHYTVTSYAVAPGNDDYEEELRGSFDSLAEMYGWLGQELMKVNKCIG